MADIQSLLKNKNMAPRAKPVGMVELGDKPLERTGSGTTGLKTSTAINLIDSFDINEDLIKFLESLNFGKYIPEFYDCEDRALWGMAHLRHMFPGAPIGVASGIAAEGPVEGQRHAVIILWNRASGGKIEPAFWDPLPSHQGLVKFGNVKSIFTFPPSDKPENTPLVTRSLNNKMLVYDEKRVVYPKGDIMNYLINAPYESECENAKAHSIPSPTIFKDHWSSHDKALWAFVHARRDFAGCPVGIAKGNKVDGRSSWTVIIYFRENDAEDGKLMHTYWDPRTNSEVKFNPTTIVI